MEFQIQSFWIRNRKWVVGSRFGGSHGYRASTENKQKSKHICIMVTVNCMRVRVGGGDVCKPSRSG